MKKHIKIIILSVTLFLYPVISLGGHIEGEETNVVILHCLIDLDKKPHRIFVDATSFNVTKNPVPMVSTKDTCAQALHELLTAGFEMTKANLETLVFLLTRKDHSTVSH